MTSQPKATRRRKPKLSKEPEGWTGRYYAAYQDEKGKSQRKRFTRDYDESVHLYHLWLAGHLDDNVEIIAVPAKPDKAMVDTSLVAISMAYDERQKRRVRGYDDQHHQGTINQQTADDIRRQISAIIDWVKKHLGRKHRSTSLENVFTPTIYEDMFLDFTKRWSQSYVNKIQTRFWSLISFAAREPYRVQLGFTKDGVPSYGGNGARHVERTLPTVSDLRKILNAADLRERTWAWLGLGCAFGPQDIARCKPIHFDEHDFDLRRGKTGVDRYGPMFPMVWSHLQLHMAQHAIKPDDLLFRTRRGKPVVWVAAKKPNAKKGKVSYTKVSALRMAWLDLLERSKSRWQGSFYTLRHLGGTSYGSRPNVSIVALRDFMGHTNINTTNRYLRAITPRNRKLIEWVTEMLDQANCDAWRD